MKKILFFAAAIVGSAILCTTTTSCKFAPNTSDGDTVAASEFYPEDTTVHAKGATKKVAKQQPIVDSVGIYYIGSGSTKDRLQLLSYPSRRDTAVYGKTRHVKVKGCADIDHVVRVQFYLLNGKDSLVKMVEEVETNNQSRP